MLVKECAQCERGLTELLDELRSSMVIIQGAACGPQRQGRKDDDSDASRDDAGKQVKKNSEN